MFYDWLVKLPHRSLPIIPCGSLTLKPSNSLTSWIVLILGCQHTPDMFKNNNSVILHHLCSCKMQVWQSRFIRYPIANLFLSGRVIFSTWAILARTICQMFDFEFLINCLSVNKHRYHDMDASSRNLVKECRALWDSSELV